MLFVFLALYTQKQILALVPELINLFAQVVVSPVETPEVKAQVGRAFSHLISLYGHQMQPLLSNLSPAHASALAAFAPKSWCLVEFASWLSFLVLYIVFLHRVCFSKKMFPDAHLLAGRLNWGRMQKYYLVRMIFFFVNRRYKLLPATEYTCSTSIN